MGISEGGGGRIDPWRGGGGGGDAGGTQSSHSHPCTHLHGCMLDTSKAISWYRHSGKDYPAVRACRGIEAMTWLAIPRHSSVCDCFVKQWVQLRASNGT